MKTICCQVWTIDEHGQRQNVTRPVVHRIEEKQSEDHAARFVLNLALEQVPQTLPSSVKPD